MKDQKKSNALATQCDSEMMEVNMVFMIPTEFCTPEAGVAEMMIRVK
jgi:hypothetical protein